MRGPGLDDLVHVYIQLQDAQLALEVAEEPPRCTGAMSHGVAVQLLSSITVYRSAPILTYIVWPVPLRPSGSGHDQVEVR